MLVGRGTGRSSRQSRERSPQSSFNYSMGHWQEAAGVGSQSEAQGVFSHAQLISLGPDMGEIRPTYKANQTSPLTVTVTTHFRWSENSQQSQALSKGPRSFCKKSREKEAEIHLGTSGLNK
jgi:hypothetical protein